MRNASSAPCVPRADALIPYPRLTLAVECVQLKATTTTSNAAAIHPDAFHSLSSPPPTLRRSSLLFRALSPTSRSNTHPIVSPFRPLRPSRPLESTIDSCNYPYLRHESNACLCIRVHGYLTDTGMVCTYTGTLCLYNSRACGLALASATHAYAHTYMTKRYRCNERWHREKREKERALKLPFSP